MPFFIFKIIGEKELEYIGEEEKYRPAREQVRELRAAHQAADQVGRENTLFGMSARCVILDRIFERRFSGTTRDQRGPTA